MNGAARAVRFAASRIAASSSPMLRSAVLGRRRGVSRALSAGRWRGLLARFTKDLESAKDLKRRKDSKSIKARASAADHSVGKERRDKNGRNLGRATNRSSALTFGTLMLTATAAAFAASSKTDALSTVAERSGFRVTGRYEEVERLCPEYAKAWPDAVRCTELGRTPEGRPMFALVASRTGALTPNDARDRGIPERSRRCRFPAGKFP